MQRMLRNRVLVSTVKKADFVNSIRLVSSCLFILICSSTRFEACQSPSPHKLHFIRLIEPLCCCICTICACRMWQYFSYSHYLNILNLETVKCFFIVSLLIHFWKTDNAICVKLNNLPPMSTKIQQFTIHLYYFLLFYYHIPSDKATFPIPLCLVFCRFYRVSVLHELQHNWNTLSLVWNTEIKNINKKVIPVCWTPIHWTTT